MVVCVEGNGLTDTAPIVQSSERVVVQPIVTEVAPVFVPPAPLYGLDALSQISVTPLPGVTEAAFVAKAQNVNSPELDEKVKVGELLVLLFEAKVPIGVMGSTPEKVVTPTIAAVDAEKLTTTFAIPEGGLSI